MLNIETTTRSLKRNARGMAAENGHTLGRFSSQGCAGNTLHVAHCTHCFATMYVHSTDRAVEILNFESRARWAPCDTSHSGL